MILRPGRRVKRSRKGDYTVHLSASERDLLRSLPGQLASLLADPSDPDLRRLFPPAYADNAEAEAEYRTLMGSDLADGHRDALRLMEETIDAERLDDVAVAAWLGAINDLRLVLGTRLGVTEDEDPPPPGDPRQQGYAVYAYLTWLQAQVIDAMSEGL